MSELASRPLSVFLCHSSGDKPTVRELHRRLDAEGWIDAWLDDEKLYPGQDWNYEIELAVEAADAILVCLTKNSVTKEGYVQRELRKVLDQADYKPEGTLFIIPVRLEECEPPRRLRTWQYVDYFPEQDRDRAYERLLASLRMRAMTLGIPTSHASEEKVRRQVEERVDTEVNKAARTKLSAGEHMNSSVPASSVIKKSAFSIHDVLSRRTRIIMSALIFLFVIIGVIYGFQTFRAPGPATLTTSSPGAVATSTSPLIAPILDTPTFAPEETPIALNGVNQSLTALDIRGGPGTEYPIVGQVDSGQTVRILGSNQDRTWLYISYSQSGSQEIIGWVTYDFISIPVEDFNRISILDVFTLTPPSIQEIRTEVSPKDDMTMVFVPAGEFKMGSEQGGIDEKPVHGVYLDAFWIDQTEVTNAMYAKCVQDEICKSPALDKSNTRSIYYGNPEYDDFPVLYVSWNDANTYCSWVERRLPREAEWEKAARGTDQRIYPWGNDSPNGDLLNFNNNLGDTTKVGSYPEGISPSGALDMAGNAWEWVADIYNETYYSSSPATNPTGPVLGEGRVLRGGAFYFPDIGVRSTHRDSYDQSFNSFSIGFRCADSP